MAVQSEKQRKEKFNSKRQLRVSFLEEGDANREDLAKEIGILRKEISQVKQEEVNKREQEQEVKDVELLKLITELKGEVAELRTRDRSKGSRWTYGCNNCKKDGRRISAIIAFAVVLPTTKSRTAQRHQTPPDL